MQGLRQLMMAASFAAAPEAVVTSGIDGVRLWTHRDGSYVEGSTISAVRHHAGGTLADFDGDGRLDWFGVRFETGNRHGVWLGRQDGTFVSTSQAFGGQAPAWGVQAADFDADGDLDAFVSTTTGTQCPADELWINDGEARFARAPSIDADCSMGAAIGDVDGDGDVDIVAANSAMDGERPDAPAMSKVWLNDGKGRFSDAGVRLGPFVAHDAAIADFDADRHQDIVIAAKHELRVALNTGKRDFRLAEESLGEGIWFAVTAADFDGDGDTDLAAANAARTGAGVWLNDGNAHFERTAQALGDRNSLDVESADFDADGDIDLAFANRVPQDESSGADAEGGGNAIWLNDGHAKFERSARGLGTGLTREIALPVVPVR